MSLKFEERIDLTRAKYILNLPNDKIESEMYDPEETNEHGDKWDTENYITRIKRFLKLAVLQKGQIKQHYKFSKRLGNSGRKLVKGFGVQSLQHKLRGFLIKDFYNDFDIINAHPTLILHLVKKKFPNKEFKNLEKYVNKRNELLTMYKASKRDILISLNSDKKTNSKNQLVISLDNEFKQIQKLFWDLDYYNHFKDSKKKNPKGSFINTVLCILENEILDIAIQKIKGVSVPMFDGFLADKSLCKEETIKKLNECTLEYGVKWCHKEHNNEIVMDESLIVENEIILDYETAKINFEEEFFMVKNPVCFVREDENNLITYSKADFQTLTECELYFEANKEGDLIEKSVFQKWIKDKKRRSYDKMDFIPTYKELPSNIYNTFRGFAYEGIPTENKEGLNLFLEHLKLLVNYEEESFKYLVSYLSHMFQKSDELPEVALLFKSQQGVGKDLLIDYLGELIGLDMIYRTSKLDEVFDRFNGALKNKIILQLNEIQGSEGFAKKEHLKNLITAKENNINEKNLKPYTLTNYLRIFIFSNNLTPIEIPHDDRRYCVFNCGKKKNREYYSTLYKNLKNKNVMESIISYFLSYDISEFDIKERPITKAYETMREANIHPIYEYLNNTFGDYGDYMEMFEGDYHIYNKSNGILIKPVDFREGFKYFLQSREQTYIKHDFKTIKLLLEELGVIQKQIRIKKKSPMNFYLFNVEELPEALKEKGFTPPEIEIMN